MTRIIQFALWALMVLVLLFIGRSLLRENSGTVIAPSDLGRGSYQLLQTDGTQFTQETLIGAPSLVFFGFTHCPDVCPTTLGDISVWQEELGSDWRDLRVFFITVDPERDSADILTEYVGWLPHARGVTGTRKEIDAATYAFRVYSKRVDLDGEDYTMDHSSSVLLFDSQGHLQGTLGYQISADEALAKIRQLQAN